MAVSSGEDCDPPDVLALEKIRMNEYFSGLKPRYTDGTGEVLIIIILIFLHIIFCQNIIGIFGRKKNPMAYYLRNKAKMFLNKRNLKGPNAICFAPLNFTIFNY